MARKSKSAYETEQDIFASRLTSIMEEKNITQTRLQEMIGKSGKTLQRQTISLYMNGQSKPDTERLTMLCNALDVSADWLLGRPHATKATNPLLKEICMYTGLSEKAIQRLPKLSELDGIIYSLGKDYEEEENACGILDTLSRMLEHDSGIQFLNDLYLVEKAVNEGKDAISECSDNESSLTHKRLKEAADIIAFRQFKLSRSAQILAESLFHSDDVTRELYEEAENHE